MPVPTDITTLSTTAGSNSPAGSESASAGDDHIRQIYSFIASLRDGSTNIVAGSAGVAAVARGGDPNTGFYFPSTDSIGLTGGGSVWMNASGLWQNPSNTQVSFRATGSASLVSSGSFNTFTTEPYDQGNNFNSSTGVFTAPVAGVYLFSWEMAATFSAIAAASAYITATSGDGPLILLNASSAGTWRGCGTFVTRLSASNTVSIAWNSGNVNVSSFICAHFAGHLLG